MRINFRPYYVTGALSVLCVIVFTVVLAAGEHGTVTTVSINGMSTERYFDYNWPSLIVFGVLGFGGIDLTRRLKRSEVGWPESWQRAFAGLHLAPAPAPGVRALSCRLMFAGPVPAQEMHGALLEAIAPDREPGGIPRVHLLASVEGRLAVAYGDAGRPPLWIVAARVSASGPSHSNAVMAVERSTPAGPGPAGGQALDAMFEHVARTVPHQHPAIAVNRATKPGAGQVPRTMR